MTHHPWRRISVWGRNWPGRPGFSSWSWCCACEFPPNLYKFELRIGRKKIIQNFSGSPKDKWYAQSELFAIMVENDISKMATYQWWRRRLRSDHNRPGRCLGWWRWGSCGGNIWAWRPSTGLCRRAKWWNPISWNCSSSKSSCFSTSGKL